MNFYLIKFIFVTVWICSFIFAGQLRKSDVLSSFSCSEGTALVNGAGNACAVVSSTANSILQSTKIYNSPYAKALNLINTSKEKQN